ncbi:MAG: aminoacyl-tRNA hydrolase [Chloroflexi bacterium]|nr:MAG: aminoacyl-tRNA hydrolase [Chloroflexota bacterium]
MPVSFPFFGRGDSRSTGPVAWLVVGLGNPGPKYEATRHNAGWHVLDLLVRRYPGLRFDKKQSKALIARGDIAGVPVLLVKPQTFMNLSGEAVGPLARFYKVPADRVLVIFDDIDLPAGALRLRPKGGAGGHKGMRSLIQHLGTEEFPRIRLGIGRPAGRMPVEAYVLQKFSPDEWEMMQITYQRAADAVEAVLTEGIDRAMNRFNLPGQDPPAGK